MEPKFECAAGHKACNRLAWQESGNPRTQCAATGRPRLPCAPSTDLSLQHDHIMQHVQHGFSRLDSGCLTLKMGRATAPHTAVHDHPVQVGRFEHTTAYRLGPSPCSRQFRQDDGKTTNHPQGTRNKDNSKEPPWRIYNPCCSVQLTLPKQQHQTDKGINNMAVTARAQHTMYQAACTVKMQQHSAGATQYGHYNSPTGTDLKEACT